MVLAFIANYPGRGSRQHSAFSWPVSVQWKKFSWTADEEHIWVMYSFSGEYMASYFMVIPAGSITASKGPGKSHAFILIYTTTLHGARKQKVICLNLNQWQWPELGLLQCAGLQRPLIFLLHDGVPSLPFYSSESSPQEKHSSPSRLSEADCHFLFFLSLVILNCRTKYSLSYLRLRKHLWSWEGSSY